MASNNRNLANLLSPGSSQIPASSLAIAGTEEYSGVDSLGVGSVIGEQAYVSGNNRLYIWNGTSWYNIALINTTPTWTSGYQPNSSYTLDADSPQSPTVITLRATDPEGLPITYSHVIGGSMDSIATISQDSSVFTITPKTQAEVGPGTHTGSITFRATDGINILPQVSSFTLDFVTVIPDSKSTQVLAAATGVGDNDDITDASVSNHTITTAGDIKAGAFSPYRHGGYSAHFVDGTDDYIKSEVTSTLNLANNTNWTVEGWYNFTDAPGTNGRYLFSNDNGTFSWSNINYMCYFNTSSTLKFEWGGGQNITMNFTPEVGRWYHLAWSCDGTTIRAFVDGNVLATNTGSTQFYTYSSAFIQIGRPPAGYGSSKEMKGHVSDFRIVVGTCVYSANFAVPSQRLTAIANTKLLTCNSVLTFADNSSQSLSLTPYGDMESSPFAPYNNMPYDETEHGGSILINPSSDYLTLPTSPTLGTSDFEISMWVYPTALVGDDVLIDWRPAGTNGSYVNIYLASGVPILHVNGAQITGSSAIPAKAWSYLTLTRVSGSTKMYVNGTQTGSTYSDSNNYLTGANRPVIGNAGYNPALGLGLEGHISDLTVKLSGNSSPSVPTAPVSSAGTSLHIKGTDGSIIDKAQTSNFTIGDGAVASSGQQHFSENTIYFDGSNDYVDINNPISGLEDHTHEAWVYPTGGNANYKGFWSSIAANGTSGINVSKDMGGGPTNSDPPLVSFSPVVPDNEWSHVVLQRQSGVHSLYRNGVLQGTSTSTVNITSTTVRLASRYNNNTTWSLGGHMHDFRISKGLARYPYISRPVTLTQTNSGMEKPDGTTPTATASNTKLLACHHSSKTTEGSATGHTITSVGSTASGTIIPKYGMNSVYFPNGDNDYLQVAASSEHQIYGGNYTVEAWLYPTSFNSQNNVFLSKGTASAREYHFSISASDFQVYWSTDGGSSGSTYFSVSVTNVLNEWAHIAIAKSGNDITLYKNGNYIGNGTFTSIYSGNSPTVIGRLWDYTGISHQYRGYISNLRIVKGQALYSANFTPPTESFKG